MDLTTGIGILFGFTFVITAILQGDSGLRQFMDLPSVFITIGGTVAATVASFSLKRLRTLPRVIRLAFVPYETDPHEVIETIVRLAELARREGLLALEDALDESEDKFLRRGIQLVVDGTDPALIKEILEAELDSAQSRHREGRKLFETMGAYAPAFGMIGTLIGLISMLAQINDPSTIGPAMAVALITTLYGSLIANLFAFPVAKKLDERDSQEALIKEMILEGILSIQSGENPRIVREKLVSFLSPAEQASRGLAAGAEATGAAARRSQADTGAVR